MCETKIGMERIELLFLSQGIALRKDQCAEVFSSERGMTSSIEDIEARFAWRKCGGCA